MCTTHSCRLDLPQIYQRDVSKRFPMRDQREGDPERSMKFLGAWRMRVGQDQRLFFPAGDVQRSSSRRDPSMDDKFPRRAAGPPDPPGPAPPRRDAYERQTHPRCARAQTVITRLGDELQRCDCFNPYRNVPPVLVVMLPGRQAPGKH